MGSDGMHEGDDSQIDRDARSRSSTSCGCSSGSQPRGRVELPPTLRRLGSEQWELGTDHIQVAGAACCSRAGAAPRVGRLGHRTGVRTRSWILKASPGLSNGVPYHRESHRACPKLGRYSVASSSSSVLLLPLPRLLRVGRRSLEQFHCIDDVTVSGSPLIRVLSVSGLGSEKNPFSDQKLQC